MAPDSPSLLSRRAWCRGAVSLAFPACAPTSSLVGDWRLDVTHSARPAASGPPLGLRVLVVADTHHPQPCATLPNFAAWVAAQQLDLIVLAGDIVVSRAGLASLQLYRGLTSRFGTVAIRGNHEFDDPTVPPVLADAYARHGIRLLVNEAIPLGVEPTLGRPRVLIGLDDHLEGSPRYAMVTEAQRRGDAVLVLAHCPVAFDVLSDAGASSGARSAMTMLSGHTHGGQIAVAGRSVVPHEGDGAYLAGWYANAAGDSVFVSRGLGWSLAPVRLGARPELATLAL